MPLLAPLLIQVVWLLQVLALEQSRVCDWGHLPSLQKPRRYSVDLVSDIGLHGDGKTDNTAGLQIAVRVAELLNDDRFVANAESEHGDLKDGSAGMAQDAGKRHAQAIARRILKRTDGRGVSSLDLTEPVHGVALVFKGPEPSEVQEGQQSQANPERIYLSRPFNLTSHLSLVLQPGARLKALPYSRSYREDPQLWPIIAPLPSYGQGRDFQGGRRVPFLMGYKVQDVEIVRGRSPVGSENVVGCLNATLDGSGLRWWFDFLVCTNKTDLLEQVSIEEMREHMYKEGLEATGSKGPHGVLEDEEALQELFHDYQSIGEGDPICENRPHLIEFYESQNIFLEGVVFQNSAFWTIHPWHSRDIHARDIRIDNRPHPMLVQMPLSPPFSCPDSTSCPRTPYLVHAINTDGFDPDSSENVIVEHSIFHVGDDGVAIKSGWDCFGIRFAKPTRNVTIENLTILGSPSAGVAIGSEMSGGVEHVRIRNSNFLNVAAGVKTKSARGRGGFVRDVEVENTYLKFGYIGFGVNEFYGGNNPSCPPLPKEELSEAAESFILPVISDHRYHHVVAEEGDIRDPKSPFSTHPNCGDKKHDICGADFEGLPNAVIKGIVVGPEVYMKNIPNNTKTQRRDYGDKKINVRMWECKGVEGVTQGRVEPKACDLLKPTANFDQQEEMYV
eukprot:gnl/MRDRNA2_/MRDRNA2_101117_c0_seq1.p1 gnl/MRDRNA2_/MRDRNA2_101117_c0~~gnl/MRDRNA2_/MRDRNA2_101117_c0_seq1.p1  ORF type:complete len:672 (+),score=88.70 gnl/MRDRNA2_/MRDRNA2_101117_c0_seq1:168-2183(+)